MLSCGFAVWHTDLSFILNILHTNSADTGSIIQPWSISICYYGKHNERHFSYLLRPMLAQDMWGSLYSWQVSGIAEVTLFFCVVEILQMVTQALLLKSVSDHVNRCCTEFSSKVFHTPQDSMPMTHLGLTIVCWWWSICCWTTEVSSSQLCLEYTVTTSQLCFISLAITDDAVHVTHTLQPASVHTEAPGLNILFWYSSTVWPDTKS